MYNSEIQFTLDTICPWTYLALHRLDRALATIRPESHGTVTFTVRYYPYQLYPDAPREGQDKRAWYRQTRYGDSDEKLAAYTHLLSAHRQREGIDFRFGGTIANTLPAHRLIQCVQEQKGPETADKLVRSLYRQYFEEERHPSSHETLMTAAIEAGIEDVEARKLLEAGDGDEGWREVKTLIRQQAGNGIDAVPYVVIEGKKRDMTLEGAKEVRDYVRALRTVVKESE